MNDKLLQEKIYILEGLGCANCAAKMEAKIRALPEVDAASIIFATRQLRVSAADPSVVRDEMERICRSIEGGVRLVDKDARAGVNPRAGSSAREEGNPRTNGSVRIGNDPQTDGSVRAGNDPRTDDSVRVGNDPRTVDSVRAGKASSGYLKSHRTDIITLALGAVLFVSGVVFEHIWGYDMWFAGGGRIVLLTFGIFLFAYLLLGWEVLLTALKNIGHGQVFDENFLMSIATIAAFCIGEYAEGAGVMLFYRIGELFEDMAVEKSRSQIMEAVDLRPETVMLVDGAGVPVEIAGTEGENGSSGIDAGACAGACACEGEDDPAKAEYSFHTDHVCQEHPHDGHVHLHQHRQEACCGHDHDHHETFCGHEHDPHPDGHLLPGDGIRIIPAEDANPGDILLVRPGDRIPLDGIVTEGGSRIDTSAVTGEPVPVSARPGTEVISGCVNLQGVLLIRVTHPLAESMVSRILDSVENAAAGKPKIDKFITRFARIYTPVVVVLAILTAILPSLITGDWAAWIKTAITFLVISCPCALVISVPLAFFSGIGAASKMGILFKGGLSMEALKRVKGVVMDKTGTITKGVFAVDRISPFGDYSKEDVLAVAAACESTSSHPVAASIMEKAAALAAGGALDEERTAAERALCKCPDHTMPIGETLCKCSAEAESSGAEICECPADSERALPPGKPVSIEETAGMGICATFAKFTANAEGEAVTEACFGSTTPAAAEENTESTAPATADEAVTTHTALCGNRVLMNHHGIALPELPAFSGTEILVALDGRLIGQIIISDQLKDDSVRAIDHLKALGLTPAMLTGDTIEGAAAVASQGCIDIVRAGLLPEDKVDALAELRGKLGPVMFVGDGINDAPVLAGADVGAAMGSGADAAIEAADVVFMKSSLEAVPQSVAIARFTGRIAIQNIVFALAVKLLVILLGFVGFANIWAAVFADTGVAMLCILNSLRVLWRKY